jgi:hypothetical protein
VMPRMHGVIREPGTSGAAPLGVRGRVCGEAALCATKPRCFMES